MADNYLITGYWGEPHVTAENDRGINAAMFGEGKFVLPVGNKFMAEYIGNNTVRMYDGKLMDSGAAAGIPANRYVDLLIANAGQGKRRNDLIVFQYSKDPSTLVESGIFTVVQGEETDGTPDDPDLTDEYLLSDMATFDQMPLWRVSVTGTAISAPEKLFSVYPGAAPAGYGLGGAGTWCDDLNTATKSGFYCWTNTAQNSPFPYGNMLVIRRGDGRITQIGIDPYMAGHGGIAIRHHTSSRWLEWEWLNPILSFGEEYRTTERSGHSPIYVKRISAGTLANKGTVKCTLPSGVSVVDLTGYALSSSGGYYPLPLLNFTTGAVRAMMRKVNNDVEIVSFDDCSAYTAYVTVKYTKG